MDSPSPFSAFWDTALRLSTWGLFALGLAWVGDSLAGRQHHSGSLRVGALLVVLSGMVLGWWNAGPAEGAESWFVFSARVAWTAGAAGFVFVLSQALDNSNGRPLARAGAATVLGMAAIVAGICIGIWAHDIYLGPTGIHFQWGFFWSLFQLVGLFGVLLIGFSEVLRGVASSEARPAESNLDNTLSRFTSVGPAVAAVFFASALGVGIWQATGSTRPLLAFWDSAFGPFTWGLLLLGLTWIGGTLAGKRHHPDFLRIGAALLTVWAIWLAWQEVGHLGNVNAWYWFSAHAVRGVGAASLIFALAQFLDYVRGRPLAKLRIVKMTGVLVVAAAMGIGVWSAYLNSLGGFAIDSVRNILWGYFWDVFGMPALFGLLTIGFAEVVQGLAVSRDAARSEIEAAEAETAV